MNLKFIYILFLFLYFVLCNRNKIININIKHELNNYKCKNEDNKDCDIKTTTTQIHTPSNLILNFNK